MVRKSSWEFGSLVVRSMLFEDPDTDMSQQPLSCVFGLVDL